MNDRDIEDTRMPEDEEEQFECCVCENLYPLTASHSRFRFLILYSRSARGVQKYVCWACREIINENIVK